MMRAIALVATSAPAVAMGESHSCVFDAEVFAAKLDCFADPTCSFAERFPIEHERQVQSMQRATAHFMGKLEESETCVTYDALHNGLVGPEDPCSTYDVEVGFALYGLIRNGVVSASNPSDLPASTFMLAENGTCN